VLPILLTFITACCVSLLATPLVLKAVSYRGLFAVRLDSQLSRDRTVPRVGGIAVFIALAGGLISAVLAGGLGDPASGAHPRFFVGLLLGGSIMFLAGLWDDVRGLRPSAKLLVQVVAATIAFGFGVRIDVVGIGAGELVLGFLSLSLTVLWVVGVTNAFNLIDGLDGLATGMAAVALATVLAAALVLGSGDVALIGTAMLGAVVGFLPYNFNPARIFLGDSGSMFLGFMLSILSVHGSLKGPTAILLMVPLFALALPLIGSGYSLMRRWLRGLPPSGTDARHIHHRLLALGLTQRRAALVMYVIAGLLASVAVLLALAPPTPVLLIALAGGGVTALLLVYGMRLVEYHEFAVAGTVLAQGFLRTRRIIQDQIFARELASLLTVAGSLQELNRLLEEQTPPFGFLAMQVCRENAPAPPPRALLKAHSPRAWKLDFPVTPRSSATDDPYVLRVWSDPGGVHRPYGAERVARILAPAIETWFMARREEATVVRRLPASRARPAIM
jgi:UDP-GlcNAc:undecaprenyl-phosphate/decaprenyl-phosphate GlcNAc-1-phosphate transferase